MEKEKEKAGEEVNVYARISAELDKRLKLACVHAGVNRPRAIAEAIELWLKKKEGGSGT